MARLRQGYLGQPSLAIASEGWVRIRALWPSIRGTLGQSDRFGQASILRMACSISRPSRSPTTRRDAQRRAFSGRHGIWLFALHHAYPFGRRRRPRRASRAHSHIVRSVAFCSPQRDTRFSSWAAANWN